MRYYKMAKDNMAASTKKFFTFHFPADLELYETLDDKNVCVISVIGKTPHQKSKFSIFNKVLDRDVFLGNNQEQGLIRGCYDAEKKVVILDCLSGYDISHLTSALKFASANDEWGSILYTKARVMLYALSVSHIVVTHCPGTSVDTSYIRLFRALDHARNKLHLSDEFSKCGLPKSWCSNGRPTCPRMLFLFNPMNPAVTKGWDSAQRRKMTIALEDQIYKIFRKTRIITNNPNSALFAVPSNHPFVHIMSSNENPSSKDNLMKLFDMHLAGGDPETLLSQESDSTSSFKELLLQHIDLAHSSGFDDSIGRNSAAGIFNIGKLKSWFMMASRLYSLILDSKPELAGASSSKLPPVFSFLKSTIEVEQRFSESRCQKVMQVAEKAYQESLPEHYTEGVHETQLAKAQHVLKTSGRGAALQTYMERLKKECTNYWMNGHRLCESISLSGNHCTHKLHRLPDEPIVDENEKLTCLEHSTSVSFSVACNCGKLTRNIGDPFTSKEANYTVYEDMAKHCCSNLPSLPFPVYVAPPVSPPHANSLAATHSPTKQATYTGCKSQTSTATAAAAKPDSEPEKVSESEGANESQRHSSNLSGKMASLSITTVSKLKQDEEDLTTISDNQSFNNSLSQGMRPETTKTDASVTDENIEPISSEDLVVDIDDNKPGYLPHMLTNTSTKGLLPDYPSWALTRLGSYSSYNSNTGLDQPGFVTSSNFLLPWEVVIKGIVKDQIPWPHVGEPTTHKQRKKMSAKRHVVDTTAKIYIGDCYTCAQGHRFMCSSPDKVTRIAGGALSSKDNANKLLTMDMPLYTTCPKGESCVGQLRHIYVCTPEIESLVVSILPKIQPAPVPCPLFLPSNEGPIKLPSNGLWVLRLPHFYVDEKGHYPLPDPQSMTSCRLLKGTFSFRNTSDPLL